MKALVERDGDRIIGFTAFGVEAGEVMAAVQVAMVAGLPYTALRDMVLTHPTIAEGLNDLFARPLSAAAARVRRARPRGGRRSFPTRAVLRPTSFRLCRRGATD